MDNETVTENTPTTNIVAMESGLPGLPPNVRMGKHGGLLTRAGLGRPKGAKGRKTRINEMQNFMIRLFSESMLKDFEQLMKVLVERAKEGDMYAMRLILERIIPIRKQIEHYGAIDAFQGVTIQVIGIDPKADAISQCPKSDTDIMEGAYS
jgi:hypothetical protein